jgi:hypothetical protein
MTKDYFKRLTIVHYSEWDLNCRSTIPHNKARNKTEKIIKRSARRKDKEFLKKILDSFEEM